MAGTDSFVFTLEDCRRRYYDAGIAALGAPLPEWNNRDMSDVPRSLSVSSASSVASADLSEFVAEFGKVMSALNSTSSNFPPPATTALPVGAESDASSSSPSSPVLPPSPPALNMHLTLTDLCDVLRTLGRDVHDSPFVEVFREALAAAAARRPAGFPRDTLLLSEYLTALRNAAEAASAARYPSRSSSRTGAGALPVSAVGSARSAVSLLQYNKASPALGNVPKEGLRAADLAAANRAYAAAPPPPVVPVAIPVPSPSVTVSPRESFPATRQSSGSKRPVGANGLVHSTSGPKLMQATSLLPAGAGDDSYAPNVSQNRAPPRPSPGRAVSSLSPPLHVSNSSTSPAPQLHALVRPGALPGLTSSHVSQASSAPPRRSPEAAYDPPSHRGLSTTISTTILNPSSRPPPAPHRLGLVPVARGGSLRR